MMAKLNIVSSNISELFVATMLSVYKFLSLSKMLVAWFHLAFLAFFYCFFSTRNRNYSSMIKTQMYLAGILPRTFHNKSSFLCIWSHAMGEVNWSKCKQEREKIDTRWVDIFAWALRYMARSFVFLFCFYLELLLLSLWLLIFPTFVEVPIATKLKSLYFVSSVIGKTATAIWLVLDCLYTIYLVHLSHDRFSWLLFAVDCLAYKAPRLELHFFLLKQKLD